MEKEAKKTAALIGLLLFLAVGGCTILATQEEPAEDEEGAEGDGDGVLDIDVDKKKKGFGYSSPYSLGG
ncbi:hypothetical protein [Calditerricola satsumensis]|uniref:Uncharacterized protein n=1 Tax=Calditerricola satsumensis TaxID=373054 RepID=A0A8J3B9W2_9BACI|nr:hypothetical protein [Calditerricola satsumensis]GGJ91727.1 hypothetical protein GCM10007043_01830 [Calditerricola satsumensis]